MLILLGVGAHFGGDAIKKAKLEDIKTDMISIKTRAKIIADEHNYNDEESFPGERVRDSNLLATFGKNQEDEVYEWDQTTLENQGLSNIEANTYIVYYDINNPNNCEVYYKEGFDGAYSLTQLEEK